MRELDPPTAGPGARRAWADSEGRIWVSEWVAGQVGVYDPATDAWREWRLPGDAPQAYAVFVDEADAVWLTDFGANAIVRFDPARAYAAPASPTPRFASSSAAPARCGERNRGRTSSFA